MLSRCTVALVLALGQGAAHSETFHVLGQAIELPPPSGYCALGGTPLERAVFERAQKSMKAHARVLQFYLPCAQQRAWAEDDFLPLDRWVVVSVPQPHQAPSLIGEGCINDLSNYLAARARLRLPSADSGADGFTSAAVEGADGRAMYWIHTRNSGREDFAAARWVTALTLVNKVEVAVNMYEATASGEPAALAAAARDYIRAIFVAAESALPSSYAARIARAVRQNLVYADDPVVNPVAEVEVVTNEDGFILSTRMVKPSGVRSWDAAVLKALDKTACLPADTNGKVVTRLIMSFRARD